MDPSPLAELLALCAYLRKRELRIEADQILMAAWLLLRKGLAPGDPAALARLSGIFCKSAADQARFALLTEEWLAGKIDNQPANPRQVGSAGALASRASALRGLPSWLWPLVYGVCVFAMLAGYVLYQYERERSFSVMVVAPVGTDHMSPLVGVDLRGARCEKTDTVIGLHACHASMSAFPLTLTVAHPVWRAAPGKVFDNYPLLPALAWSHQLPTQTIRLENIDAPGPLGANKNRPITVTGARGASYFLPAPAGAQAGSSLTVTMAAVVALFGALFLAGLAWMRHHATLARGKGPLAPRTLSLQGGAELRPLKHWRQAMQAFALSLRQPERGYGTRLAARKTVDASARKAGLFTPVYGGARERRFLAFVRRESQQDHEAFMGEALIAELFRSGADVLAFRFDSDANVVEPYTPVLREGQKAFVNEQACFPTMEQVLAANEQAECLVFCEPSAMTNQVSGELADWSAKLVARAPRCTVFSLGRSGPGDRTVAMLAAAGARLSCFDAAALQSLGHAPHIGIHARGSDHMAMPRALGLTLQLRRRRPPQVEVDALCGAIGAYMGQLGLRWVRACAIYPDINWALTNALGCALVDNERERERLLFRLSQMVWFRHAYLPDWLRTELAGKLSASEQAWLRDFYWELFEKQHATDNIVVSVAQGASRVRRLLLRARAILGLRSALRSAREREQIYLRFLLGRPMSPLNLSVPERIVAALSDAARTPRAVLAAMCVTGAVVALLWAQAAWRGTAMPHPSAVAVSVGFGTSQDRLVFGTAFGPDRMQVGIIDLTNGGVISSRETVRAVQGDEPVAMVVIPESELVASLGDDSVVLNEPAADGKASSVKVKVDGSGPRWLALAGDGNRAVPLLHVARQREDRAAFSDLSTLAGNDVKSMSAFLLNSDMVKEGKEFAFDPASPVVLMRMDRGTATIQLATNVPMISGATAAVRGAKKLLKIAAADNQFAECWDSGLIRLWHNDSFKSQFAIEIGTASACTALAIIPGAELVAVGTADGMVVLVGGAAASPVPVQTSYGGHAAVASIAYSPKFRRMAIARSDLSVSVVDFKTTQPVVPDAASAAAAAASAASVAASGAASASESPRPRAPANTPRFPGKGVDTVRESPMSVPPEKAERPVRQDHFGDEDPAQQTRTATAPADNAMQQTKAPPQRADSAVQEAASAQPPAATRASDTAVPSVVKPSTDGKRVRPDARELPPYLDKK